MKKLLYLASLILALGFVSCEKEEIGGTAIKDFCGEWYVTCELITDGEPFSAQDLYELEEIGATHFIVRTYNTASNEPNKMWISDMEQFGAGFKGAYTCAGFRTVVDLDKASGEFSNPDYVKNSEVSFHYATNGIPEFADIKIANGKIIPGGGVQNNGSVTDAIEFDLYTKDGYFDSYFPDAMAYYYGMEFVVDHIHFKGVRYSGLVEND